VVTSIWLKFGVTLFAQAFETVELAALAELAGKTKTAAAATASTASTALRRLNMSHTPFRDSIRCLPDLAQSRSRRRSREAMVDQG
jgi:hypothetical protein